MRDKTTFPSKTAESRTYHLRIGLRLILLRLGLHYVPTSIKAVDTVELDSIKRPSRFDPKAVKIKKLTKLKVFVIVIPHLDQW